MNYFVLHEGIIYARDVYGINTTAFRALRVVSPWPRRTVRVGYIITCSKPCLGMLWWVMLCNGYVRMPNVYCRYGYHSWKPITAVYTANHLCSLSLLMTFWPYEKKGQNYRKLREVSWGSQWLFFETVTDQLGIFHIPAGYVMQQSSHHLCLNHMAPAWPENGAIWSTTAVEDKKRKRIELSGTAPGRFSSKGSNHGL